MQAARRKCAARYHAVAPIAVKGHARLRGVFVALYGGAPAYLRGVAFGGLAACRRGRASAGRSSPVPAVRRGLAARLVGAAVAQLRLGFLGVCYGSVSFLRWGSRSGGWALRRLSVLRVVALRPRAWGLAVVASAVPVCPRCFFPLSLCACSCGVCGSPLGAAGLPRHCPVCCPSVPCSRSCVFSPPRPRRRQGPPSGQGRLL